MARGRSTEDLATLQMALVGYQVEKQRIEDRIRAIQAQLKGRRLSPASASDRQAPGTKRVLSPAARRRIAAAQRKRWAEHRRRAAQADKAAKEE